jgi:hypothetical protein
MCVLISTSRGVFIGVQGGVTDLVKSVTHQVVADRSSHVAGQPCGSACTDFLHCLGLPLLVHTCVHDAMGQINIKLGQPARGFSRLSTSWAHWSAAFAHCLHMSGTSLG